MPTKITINGSQANDAACASYNGDHGTTIDVRQVRYLNNVVGQDHRAAKRITRLMLGFKSFDAAQYTLAGTKLIHMLRKGQREAGDEQNLTSAQQSHSLAA